MIAEAKVMTDKERLIIESAFRQYAKGIIAEIEGQTEKTMCHENRINYNNRMTFNEWKAINSDKIEELADYFMAHDTEGYFIGDRYVEAYDKIESLCKLAFDRKE